MKSPAYRRLVKRAARAARARRKAEQE
jgi:hypothetical protein